MSNYISPSGAVNQCDHSESIEPEQEPTYPFIKLASISQNDTAAQSHRDLGLMNLNKFRLATPLDQQISFQKDILLEHISTINKQAQNLKEFDQAILSSPSSTAKLSAQLHTQYHLLLQQHSEDDRALRFVSEIANRNYFLTDLQKHKELRIFYKNILQKLHLSLAVDLIAISAQFWTQFQNLNFRDVRTKQIEKQVKKYLRKESPECFESPDNYYFRIDFHHLQTGRSEKQIIHIFNTFLHRYLVTMLLVAAGYFQNPYFSSGEVDGEAEEDSGQLSIDLFSNNEDCSSEEQGSKPIKRVKLQ